VNTGFRKKDRVHRTSGVALLNGLVMVTYIDQLRLKGVDGERVIIGRLAPERARKCKSRWPRW